MSARRYDERGLRVYVDDDFPVGSLPINLIMYNGPESGAYCSSDSAGIYLALDEAKRLRDALTRSIDEVECNIRAQNGEPCDARCTQCRGEG